MKIFLSPTFQNIVYGEYVREIVGPALFTEYNLDPAEKSYYQPDRNPGIINAFATAAFRFGHSQVRLHNRVTHQVELNIPLTSKQKFRFGFSRSS